MVKIQNDSTKCLWDVEQHAYFADGNVKWCCQSGKQFVSHKDQCILSAHDLGILLGIYPREMKNYNHVKICAEMFPRNWIHNSPQAGNKLQHTSVDEWINCHAFSYHGVLLNNKKEQTTGNIIAT